MGVESLNNTVIEGNSRYIDVKSDESDKRPPSRSTSVFVRGFDFGTTDEQLEAHMASAGTIVKVQWCDKGSAIVSFSSADEAMAAVQSLNQTIIKGNTRYIDVVPNTKVFVRGFDFGTTDAQLEAHLGSAGTIEKVSWCDKGSAIVTFSTPEEADAAVQNLNQTTITGNKRFIDVLAKEERPQKKARTSGSSLPWQHQQLAAVLKAMTGKGWGKAKGGNATAGFTRRGAGSWQKDPPGTGRVYVRGFDFGTTDEQLLAHCSRAGEILQVKWCTKGSAILIYSTKAEANKAVRTLNQTTIDGNTRYLDVVLKESE